MLNAGQPSSVMNVGEDPQEQSYGWNLVGCLPGESQQTRVALTSFPFLIGRATDNHLEIPSRSVSKHHARVFVTNAVVFVQDIGSTNGTCVNGKRVHEPTPISTGDLVQFADVEFRVDRSTRPLAEHTFAADGFEQGWMITKMNEVLHGGGLSMHFQPILKGRELEPFGYEALARAQVAGLESPLQLFNTAERLGLETDLSRLCRSEAVRIMDEAGVPGTLFLNMHPLESADDELIESLFELRQVAGERVLVLEIHEAALADMASLPRFKNQLQEMNILLAYDDFGVGQSRIRELAEVPPDFLKFDRSMVKDLGSPKAIHANLVRMLHQHARDLGIQTVAEGIDLPEAAAACQDMGFTHYQGFLFARPKPIEEWV